MKVQQSKPRNLYALDVFNETFEITMISMKSKSRTGYFEVSDPLGAMKWSAELWL